MVQFTFSPLTKMPDLKAFGMIKRAGIPIPSTVLTKNITQAKNAAKKFGWPVLLKISSPDIVHKTEVGGIAIARNEAGLAESYTKILTAVRRKAPKARIDGIIVQQLCIGWEMLVGAKHDPQFGPVLAFGTGGLFVEILKDISFRLIPITRQDARQMITEIRGYDLLRGARGTKPVNLKALEDCLLRLSRLVWTNKRIKELDINPLFVSSKGVMAADVRILV